MIRVLYFGFYNPSYPRNRVLMKGLRSQGFDVVECRGSSWWELWRKHRALQHAYDVMIVGFPGQKVMFLARWLTRKPIIFDAFTSHFGGYILDRQIALPRSLRAQWYRFLDRWSCRLADRVLLDTLAHIDFFVDEFKLARKKFVRVFVGTDTDIFYPHQKNEHKNFIVHFHGSGIPLQGIDIIYGAKKILINEQIEFQIITNQNHVPYEKLPGLMSRADVCLGIFGLSPKTDLVIPNKAYEALAMAKPLITADTPAVRELLQDGVTAVLCKQGDAKALAQKILLLRDDSKLRTDIADRGHELFQDKATELKIGQQIILLIYEITSLQK